MSSGGGKPSLLKTQVMMSIRVAAIYMTPGRASRAALNKDAQDLHGNITEPAGIPWCMRASLEPIDHLHDSQRIAVLRSAYVETGASTIRTAQAIRMSPRVPWPNLFSAGQHRLRGQGQRPWSVRGGQPTLCLLAGGDRLDGYR